MSRNMMFWNYLDKKTSAITVTLHSVKTGLIPRNKTLKGSDLV